MNIQNNRSFAYTAHAPLFSSVPQPQKQPVHARQVQFGGNIDRGTFALLGLLILAPYLGTAAVVGGLGYGGYRWHQHSKQAAFEKLEPTCSKVITDRGDFEKLVTQAGGRENVVCTDTSFATTPKK